MKRIIPLMMAVCALAFAVSPKPKTGNTKTTPEKEKIKIEFVKPEKVDRNDKNNDLYIDADSNGVNDQREDDFKNIKELKTKHKDKDTKDRGKEKGEGLKQPEIKIKLKKPTR